MYGRLAPSRVSDCARQMSAACVAANAALTDPPATELVRKSVFDERFRIVFAAGLEGTGYVTCPLLPSFLPTLQYVRQCVPCV
jgi:hypothetical protein